MVEAETAGQSDGFRAAWYIPSNPPIHRLLRGPEIAVLIMSSAISVFAAIHEASKPI